MNVLAISAEEKPSDSRKSAGVDYTIYELGGADISPKTEPGLVLMGGGGDVDEAMRWFIQKAGGGDLVVLRAGGGDGYQDYFFKQLGGLNSVTSIVFDSAKPASDPAILQRIANAEGIFLAGGDQARYYACWENTPLAAALVKHYHDGKPLGGTSAGLAVLGGWCYSARHDTVISKEALADPFEKRVTLEKGMFDLPIIAGLFTDSHFTQRERLGRLVAFLARLRAQKDSVELIGVGVDERTALCIDGAGHAKVVSADGKGRVSLVKLTEPPKTVIAGKPLEVAKVAVQVLPAGRQFALEKIEEQFKDAPLKSYAAGSEIVAAPTK